MGKDELMTVIDAARYLGIHQQTVRDAIKRGKLSSERVLGRIALRRSHVDAYKSRTQPDGKPRQDGGRPRSKPPPTARDGGAAAETTEGSE